jgi:hypothetical protein
MISLLFSLACAPSGDSGAPAADTEHTGPEDTGPVDTGEDTLADQFNCGLYAPQASATLPFGEPSTRAVYNGTESSVITSETWGQEVYEGWDTWVYHTLSEMTTPLGVEISTVIHSHYICEPDGLRHHRIDLEFTQVEAGKVISESTESWQMHDHPMVYPIDLALGSSWVYETAATKTVDGVESEWTLNRTREIIAVEEVTVPAGTFEALVLFEQDDSKPESREDDTLYLAEWVGMIKSTGAELASFERLDQ